MVSSKQIMDAYHWLRMCPSEHLETLQAPLESTAEKLTKASICIIQEAVRSSFFPGPIADSIIEALVPQDHQHLLRGGTSIVNLESPPNFHKFPCLPTELRLMVWRFAVMNMASYPRCRVLFDSSNFRFPPCDVHTHERTPPLAQVCSEARGVTFDCGYLGQFRETSFCNWISPEDTILINPVMDNWNREHNMDHILSRTTIAFESDVFNSFLELRRALWLRGPALKLKTAFMIYNHVNFYVRVERASLTPEMAKLLKSINRILKIIPHDDRDQIDMLETFWRTPSEAPGFVRPWKSGPEHAKSCRAGWPKQALFGISCTDCERALCEYLCTTHIKYQWLKILAHPAPKDITDSWDHYFLDEQGLYPVDMFPTANTYNATHPWIREALKRIPELRPAVALRVYIDIVDDGDTGRNTPSASTSAGHNEAGQEPLPQTHSQQFSFISSTSPEN